VKSTGKKVKALRCDNGGEYTSSEFADFLTKEGIKQELTTPHTPQLNGTAERLNRTLIEGVHTMLADSKLPHMFWAEALSTCVYLRNRSPTKSLNRITPYEAWYGVKPNVASLIAVPMLMCPRLRGTNKTIRQESVSCLGMVRLRKGIVYMTLLV